MKANYIVTGNKTPPAFDPLQAYSSSSVAKDCAVDYCMGHKVAFVHCYVNGKIDCTHSVEIVITKV